MTATKIKANFEFFSKKVRAKQKKHAKTDKFKILASSSHNFFFRVGDSVEFIFRIGNFAFAIRNLIE